MKAITLTQPWATLVALGAKRIETRSWSTSYRGLIAIHAAKTFPGWAKDLCYSDVFRRALGWPQPPSPLTQEWLNQIATLLLDLPLGAVIATARLVACFETSELRKVDLLTTQEEAFGDYSPCRFGFLLENIVPSTVGPIPVKGSLGLWNWEPPVSLGFVTGI